MSSFNDGNRDTPSRWLDLRTDGAWERIAFLAGPHSREVCYLEHAGYVPHTRALAAQGKAAQLRVSFNVVLVDAMQVRVFEHTTPFFRQVLGYRNKLDLDSHAFTLTRHDKPFRNYKLTKPTALSAAQVKAMQALPRYDLSAVYATAPAPERLCTYDALLASGKAQEIDPFM